MVQKEHVFVEVVRDSIYSPWGIRISGGADYSAPITVQRVNIGAPCEAVLRSGDIIVAVGGVETAGMTHAEVTSAISNAGSRLPIVVLRDAAGSMPARQGRASSQPPQMSTSVARGGTPLRDAHHGPPEFGGSLPRRFSMHGEKDEIPIATNSQLAGMMKTSLARHAPPRRPVGLTSVDLLLRHPRHDILRGPEYHDDVTVYLPRLVPAPRHQHQHQYQHHQVGPEPQTWAPPPRTLRAGTPDKNVTITTGAADRNARDVLTDSVISAGDHASGRSTPQVVFEFSRGTPHGRNKPAVGVWTPPAHQPTARLVHAQYDTPLGMYTPENVADMIHKQTGTKLRWAQKPRVRFMEDIRESATYRYVNALESGGNPHELPVGQRAVTPALIESEPQSAPYTTIRSAPIVKPYQRRAEPQEYAQSNTFRRLHNKLAHLESEVPERNVQMGVAQPPGRDF